MKEREKEQKRTPFCVKGKRMKQGCEGYKDWNVSQTRGNPSI